MATHAPMLMACLGARLLHLSKCGLESVRVEDRESSDARVLVRSGRARGDDAGRVSSTENATLAGFACLRDHARRLWTPQLSQRRTSRVPADASREKIATRLRIHTTRHNHSLARNARLIVRLV
jgi:hypothetical protein